MDGRRYGGLWQKTGFILGAGTQKAPRRRVLTAEPEVVNSEKSCHGRGSHGRAPKCIFLTINMWVPENDGKRISRERGGDADDFLEHFNPGRSAGPSL